MTRRKFMQMGTGTLGGALLGTQGCASLSKAGTWQIATFQCDVTPPLGHPLMGGGIEPAKMVQDRLYARGFILLGSDEPLVFVSVEWCEIRNDALKAWREGLAAAVGTNSSRVLVSSVHVHDAPIADLSAERLLRASQAKGSVCDLSFHEDTVRRVSRTAKESLKTAKRFTHIGTGQAEVQNIASNRRYLLPDGKPSYDRMSANRNVIARDADAGTIDPNLRTLSFWDGDRALVAVHSYATHPMSHYGRGTVSADFPGIALAKLQASYPAITHIYASGCSGNVTAGKWNDGSPENRARLADRLHKAMNQAWRSTERHLVTTLQFRSTPLKLVVRSGPGFTVQDLSKRLASDPKPFGQCLAALGLSWRYHAGLDSTIDVPTLNFQSAQLLLLPAESYVEYQLFAQSLRPDRFVLTCGYGECGPGYIPIERAWEESDSNLHDWCWVAPGSEAVMKRAIRTAIG